MLIIKLLILRKLRHETVKETCDESKIEVNVLYEIIKVKAANYKIWDFNNSTVPNQCLNMNDRYNTN